MFPSIIAEELVDPNAENDGEKKKKFRKEKIGFRDRKVI